MKPHVIHTQLWRLPLQVIYFIYVALSFIALLIVFFPLILALTFLPVNKRDILIFHFMFRITPFWMYLCGLLARRYNTQCINPHQQYIVTPNHQSYLDAALVYRTIASPFKSLGKSDLLKVPLYGTLYQLTVIPVDRSSTLARANSVRRMKQHFDRGISLLIFPEGTFPDEAQNELVRFQPGAFSLAIQYQAPVLPVLFPNAARRMHPKQFWRMSPGKTPIVFLPPIETKHLQKEHTSALTTYTQHYMQECLDHCRQEGPASCHTFAHHWRTKHPFHV